MKIFLTQNYVGSYRTGRILYIVMGVFFMLSSINTFLEFDGSFSFELLFRVIYSLLGAFAVFYGAVLLSPKSKFAPRFEFTSNGIIIRKDVFSKNHHVEWKDIKKVKYGSFEVSFTTEEGEIKTYPIYTKNSDNSIAVKEEITKRAEELGIEVVAG